MSNFFYTFSECLDVLREETHHAIEAQSLSVLINVMAVDPDYLYVSDLMELTNSSQGSVQRNLRILGSEDNHPRGKKCYNLLESHFLISDMRRKAVVLSPKGKALKAKISKRFFMC